MTTPIFIQNIDLLSGELEDFSFDENESVYKVLTRYLSSKRITTPLSSFSFMIGQDDINNSDDLYEPLSDYISKGGLISMKLREKKYSAEAFEFSNISKRGSIKKTYSETAPYYRTINKGLNIFGKCICKKCELYHKTVVVQKGKCTINLMDPYNNELPCPACGGFIKPITVAFYKCKYSITGDKIEERKLISIEPITGIAEDDQKCDFFDPQINGSALFFRLVFNIPEIL